MINTSRLILAGTLALTIAGCQDRKDAENATDAAPVTVEEAAPNAAQVDGAQAEANIAEIAEDTGPARGAIPAAFHGRWGMVPGDCGPDLAIAKGLLTIDGEKLRFYESVGKPTVVTSPTPSRVEGRFAFTGEGMEWVKTMTLTVEGKGDVLVTTETDPKVDHRYTRCPR